MLPSASAPVFDEKGDSAINYAQQLELWRQVTNLDPVKRASALISYMDTGAREVCMAAGSDGIMDHGRARTDSDLSHDYFAPAAAVCVYQKIVRFSQVKRLPRRWMDILCDLISCTK